MQIGSRGLMQPFDLYAVTAAVIPPPYMQRLVDIGDKMYKECQRFNFLLIAQLRILQFGIKMLEGREHIPIAVAFQVVKRFSVINIDVVPVFGLFLGR